MLWKIKHNNNNNNSNNNDNNNRIFNDTINDDSNILLHTTGVCSDNNDNSDNNDLQRRNVLYIYDLAQKLVDIFMDIWYI